MAGDDHDEQSIASSRPVGRFAPSPTGDLHFGSLLAALASYCDIRSRHGQWQLRIDDIDGPRSVPGSASAIQRTLELYGFQWDGPVRWQSQHMARYRSALDSLVGQKRVFCCSCSRRMLQPGKVYPGTCRDNRLLAATQSVQDTALRLILDGKTHFQDRIQGHVAFDLAVDCGDSIIWRRDKLVSYALACAVDDGSDISDVVRGADLLDSTGVQLAIMRLLKLSAPRYSHIPIAIDNNSDKLSKHSKAAAISTMDPLDTLQRAWRFLGQPDVSAENVEQFWAGAVAHWDITRISRTTRQSI